MKMERMAREKENAIEEIVESPKKVKKQLEDGFSIKQRKKKQKESLAIKEDEDITKCFQDIDKIVEELQVKKDRTQHSIRQQQ